MCFLRTLIPAALANQIRQLVDGYHSILAQVQRMRVIGAHQLMDAGHAIVDVAK